MTRRRILTGAALLMGCGVYLVGEAIAATAWHDPQYSYVRNYISDLGVAAGVGIHRSPLAWVFNGGILLNEVFMILGVLVLAPLLQGRSWRGAVVAFALVHGVGSVIVALIHSAPGTLAGTPRVHLVGAYLSITGGNLALCAVGIGALRQRGSVWFASPIVLGLAGIAGGIALLAVRGSFAGLFERVAVDSITLGEMSIGAMLVAATLLSKNRGVPASGAGFT